MKRTHNNCSTHRQEVRRIHSRMNVGGLGAVCLLMNLELISKNEICIHADAFAALTEKIPIQMVIALIAFGLAMAIENQ
jgi:hypothetical protein